MKVLERTKKQKVKEQQQVYDFLLLKNHHHLFLQQQATAVVATNTLTTDDAHQNDLQRKDDHITLYLHKSIMATEYDHDLFVIGCGSGGIRATRIAGGYGAKVAVADDLAVGLGGTCVNVGCVPKKLFVYGSLHGHHWKNQVGFGYNVDPNNKPNVSWQTLVENKDKEIARLNGIYERMALGSGADLIKQRAEIVDAHTVQLADGTKRTAKKILVAVGGWPYVPTIPKGGNEHLITSNECFYLKQAPKKVVVWGGGYIAVRNFMPEFLLHT